MTTGASFPLERKRLLFQFPSVCEGISNLLAQLVVRPTIKVQPVYSGGTDMRELVSAIYVEAPVEINGKRHQNICIEYDFIGLIPLEELGQYSDTDRISLNIFP